MNAPPIVQDAADALRARGAALHVLGAEVAVEGRRLDLVAEVSFRGAARAYAVEVSGRATTASVARIAGGAADLGALLVAPYVTPSVQDACRGTGVDFVDAVGNMYLDLGAAVLDVTGRRPTQDSPRDGGLRMLRPSGLRVLLGLLADPELVAAPFRTIAEETGTALGSVQRVMKELTHERYVEEPLGDRVLHRTGELFDRWVAAYVTASAGRLARRFSAVDPTAWFEGLERLEDGAVWGGEVAAYRLDRYLRPGRALVYAPGDPTTFLVHHRLRRTRADDWHVEVRERFWGPRVGAVAPPDVTPTPLVYADLVRDGDPRLLDTARRLRARDPVLVAIDAR